jgi:hypothetical protein
VTKSAEPQHQWTRRGLFAAGAGATAATLVAGWPQATQKEAPTAAADAVQPEQYGAVGDGETLDTEAFTKMVKDQPPVITLTPGRNYLIDPNTLDLFPGTVLAGANGGGYPTVDADDKAMVSRITLRAAGKFDPTTDAGWDTGKPAYWGVRAGTKCIIRDVQVVPQNLRALPYYAANYPKSNGAPTVGILAGDASRLTGVVTQGFRVGTLPGKVVHFTDCFASMCDIGYYLKGSDGWMRDCGAMYCYSAGVQARGNYWQYHGGRYEWNARYGIVTSAENITEGVTFDRNGWAGLYLAPGRWGQVVTGNYFSRNGVGGNGTTGRWSWARPGNPAYVHTPAAESCHIKIDYQRRVAITGNSYRAGGDDAKGGVVGPVYIYSSAAANHASSGVVRAANAGESGDSLGYSAAGAGYAGVTGAAAGGSDTTLAKAINESISGH